jgi:hypothetical protein
MKNITRFLLCAAVAVAIAAPAARAESKQVTTLSTSASAVIVVPGATVNCLTITNVGANAVNITFDNGSSGGGTDPTTGATGNGLPLAAGQTVSFAGAPLRGVQVKAIMQTGTTVLNICTDAPAHSSIFPTN